MEPRLSTSLQTRLRGNAVAGRYCRCASALLLLALVVLSRNRADLLLGGGDADPPPTTTPRSAEWIGIYNRIGRDASDETPLHHIGGYNMFTVEEWDQQVRTLIEACGIAGLNETTPIFEGGVGGGAFLDALHRMYGCASVGGCDHAREVVNMAKKRLPWGDFWVGDASDLRRVPDASQRLSLMYGVTPYMNDEDHVRRAVNELIRITRPGGWVLVAENNDQERRDVADALRRESHKLPSNHLFISPSLWEGFPNARVLDHRDLGLKNPMSPYRNSVVIRV